MNEHVSPPGQDEQRRETIAYVVRHAHIPSHEHDVALTEEGVRAAEEAGREFAGRVVADEVVFLHGPARRARETAEAMYRGLVRALAETGGTAHIFPPAPQAKLCNVRMWVDGYLQEAMRLLHDAVRAAYQETPSPEHAARLAYHDAFWSAPDAIAYWLAHPSPYAEPPEAVASRLAEVIRAQLSIRPAPPAERRHVVCISHSGPMRAFLRAVLGEDPGEPDFCEHFAVWRDPDRTVWLAFRGQLHEISGPVRALVKADSGTPRHL